MDSPPIDLPSDLEELEAYLADAKRIVGLITSLSGLGRPLMEVQLCLKVGNSADPYDPGDDSRRWPVDSDPLLDRLFDLVLFSSTTPMASDFRILIKHARDGIEDEIIPDRWLPRVLGRLALFADRLRVEASEKLGIPLNDEQRKVHDPFDQPKMRVRIRPVDDRYLVSLGNKQAILNQEQGAFLLAAFGAGGYFADPEAVRRRFPFLEKVRVKQLFEGAPAWVLAMLENQPGKGSRVKPEFLA